MRLRVLGVAALILLAGCGAPDRAARPVMAISTSPSTIALDDAVDDAIASVSAQWDAAGREACALAQGEVFGGKVLDPAAPAKIVKAGRRSGSAVLREEADRLAAALKNGTESDRVSALAGVATVCVNGS